MAVLRIEAPAKINLYLEIRGQRPDGYHELRTVMHTLDLTDTLLFYPSQKRLHVTSDHPLVPGGEANLAYQAAEKLALYLGRSPHVHIHIHKRIPVAAGLGGGSSDAAAVLRGLSQLWGKPPRNVLLRLARELGSDVPFCLQGGCALGWGRGERISPWPALPGFCLVLINPGFPVSTSQVYKKTSLRLTTKTSYINMMRQAVFEKNLIKIGQNLFNHLENITIKLHPIVGQIKRDLLACGAKAALMSGSGPTVFAFVPSVAVGRMIINELGPRYAWVKLARTREGFF